MAKLQKLAVLINEDWAIGGWDPEDEVDDDDGVPPGPITPAAAVVAQMLSHHKVTLNEMFNQGGEDVVVENLLQDGVWWKSGEPSEVVLDAQADWFDYMEDEPGQRGRVGSRRAGCDRKGLDENKMCMLIMLLC